MKILIISFSNIQNDPRVYRQLTAYSNEHQVTTLGRGSLEVDGIKHVSVPGKSGNLLFLAWRFVLLLFRRYDLYIRYTYPFEKYISEFEDSYDVIIANDVETLPFASRIKNGAKLIFDAHEYSPRQLENNLLWRLLLKPLNTSILHRYLPFADEFLTVGNGIAEEYSRVFGRKPIVVTNASRFKEIDRSVTKGKEENKKIRLIHHGGANPARRIDLMIQMMDFLDDRYELTLMLMTSKNKKYFNSLEKMAASKNVIFRRPVPMPEIVNAIKEYDIGVYILPPANFNQEYALPNKIFEYIQARLAVAIGPSKEMADLVTKYDIGVVADDFSPESLARAIKSITPEDLLRYRRNCDAAAREENAENNIELLKSLI